MTTTIAKLFSEARQEAPHRAEYQHFFHDLEVATGLYYGSLHVARERGQWTAVIYIILGHRQAHGNQTFAPTVREALDSLESLVNEWAAQVAA